MILFLLWHHQRLIYAYTCQLFIFIYIFFKKDIYTQYINAYGVSDRAAFIKVSLCIHTEFPLANYDDALCIYYCTLDNAYWIIHCNHE